MAIFKIDPRCLPFFSDVLRKIMSAGTRWFCVMNRETVTVSAPGWGILVPLPRVPSVGSWRGGGGNQNPQPLLSVCLCWRQTWGFILFLNLKNLACCCYTANPLLKSYLRKKASCFLANPTITSCNCSPQTRGPEACSPSWLSSRLSAETKDRHTLGSCFLLLPVFWLDVWL